MPDTQPTGKILKSMPEGVEKGLSLTLRSFVGLNGTRDDKTDKRHQNIEQLFSTPTMSQLPDGFKTSGWFDDMPSYDAPMAVGLALMTRRKRPIATFLVNHSDGTGEGIVVFAMRGDRKETKPKFIELEGDVVDIFTDSLFMTHPRNCSNFHPWFSSILMSFAKVCRGKSGEVDVCMVNEDTDRKIKRAIESNRIVVAVCPPNSMTTEHLFHKLAQEAKLGTLTKDQVKLHEDEWERVVWKPSGESQSPVKLLKSVSSAINNYFHPWLDNRKSCGKNEDPIDDDTSVANQPATNPDAKMTDDNVVSVASELTKSGISKKKYSISTQSKFVSDSVTGSMTGLKREIEKEEEQTKAFAKKMKAVNPKGKCSSDKKSTEEHQNDEKSNSGSESEMSVDESDEDESDESDDSDEDESDDSDDSDEDESDKSDDSDEDKSDENDSDEDKKEEKESKHKRPKTPETNSENKVWKQPTLAFDGCGNPKPSASNPGNNRGTGEAQRARHLVAAQAKLTFDAVENCNGIPLSSTEKMKNILDKLRAKYVDYGGDKPPRTTYAMHTDGFELTMALVNILNAHNGVAQQGADGNATRRLAVNTTAALLQIIPSINNVTTSLQSSLSAIGELNNIATSVSEDFNKTVATLSTSETP